MKSKIKVSYVIAGNEEELQNMVNIELEAIQVNVKNKVKDIRFGQAHTGYIAQITYEENEDIQILNENVEAE